MLDRFPTFPQSSAASSPPSRIRASRISPRTAIPSPQPPKQSKSRSRAKAPAFSRLPPGPSLPFPADSGEETPASEPGLAAQGSAGQSGTDFYLCDEGGRVVVYTCSDNGLPDKRLLRTGIYVNLLPEADALRLKQGLYVTGETALRALLEDLGE